MDLSKTVLVANRNNSYLLTNDYRLTESTCHARCFSKLSHVILAIALMHRKGNRLLYR